MDFSKLILTDNYNYEFAYDEADLLAYVKEYIETFGYIRKEYWNYERDSYEKTVYLWLNNLYEYVIEMYNSLMIGNLYSFRVLLRTLLENVVYFECIIRYKEKGLWKHWELYSYANMLQRFSKSDDEGKSDNEAIANMRTAIEKKFAVEGLQYKENFKETDWLEGVFKNRSMKYICNQIGRDDYYEDYQELCSFVHGQNVFVKNNPSAFYNELISKIVVALNLIYDVADLVSNTVEPEEELLDDLWDLRSMIFTQMMDEGWVRE